MLEHALDAALQRHLHHTRAAVTNVQHPAATALSSSCVASVGNPPCPQDRQIERTAEDGQPEHAPRIFSSTRPVSSSKPS